MAIQLTQFQKFPLNLGKGVFDLATDTLKVALTNTAPTAASDEEYDDLVSPISADKFDGATPFDITTTSFTQTDGVAKLVLADLTLTASEEAGPFRYIVVYSDTASNKELIGYYDYGSSITLEVSGSNKDTFKIVWDGTNGVITIGQS